MCRILRIACILCAAVGREAVRETEDTAARKTLAQSDQQEAIGDFPGEAGTIFESARQKDAAGGDTASVAAEKTPAQRPARGPTIYGALEFPDDPQLGFGDPIPGLVKKSGGRDAKLGSGHGGTTATTPPQGEPRFAAENFSGGRVSSKQKSELLVKTVDGEVLGRLQQRLQAPSPFLGGTGSAVAVFSGLCPHRGRTLECVIKVRRIHSSERNRAADLGGHCRRWREEVVAAAGAGRGSGAGFGREKRRTHGVVQNCYGAGRVHLNGADYFVQAQEYNRRWVGLKKWLSENAHSRSAPAAPSIFIPHADFNDGKEGSFAVVLESLLAVGRSVSQISTTALPAIGDFFLDESRLLVDEESLDVVLAYQEQSNRELHGEETEAGQPIPRRPEYASLPPRTVFFVENMAFLLLEMYVNNFYTPVVHRLQPSIEPSAMNDGDEKTESRITSAEYSPAAAFSDDPRLYVFGSSDIAGQTKGPQFLQEYARNRFFRVCVDFFHALVPVLELGLGVDPLEPPAMTVVMDPKNATSQSSSGLPLPPLRPATHDFGLPTRMTAPPRRLGASDRKRLLASGGRDGEDDNTKNHAVEVVEDVPLVCTAPGEQEAVRTSSAGSLSPAGSAPTPTDLASVLTDKNWHVFEVQTSSSRTPPAVDSGDSEAPFEAPLPDLEGGGRTTSRRKKVQVGSHRSRFFAVNECDDGTLYELHGKLLYALVESSARADYDFRGKLLYYFGSPSYAGRLARFLGEQESAAGRSESRDDNSNAPKINHYYYFFTPSLVEQLRRYPPDWVDAENSSYFRPLSMVIQQVRDREVAAGGAALWPVTAPTSAEDYYNVRATIAPLGGAASWRERPPEQLMGRLHFVAQAGAAPTNTTASRTSPDAGYNRCGENYVSSTRAGVAYSIGQWLKTVALENASSFSSAAGGRQQEDDTLLARVLFELMVRRDLDRALEAVRFFSKLKELEFWTKFAGVWSFPARGEGGGGGDDALHVDPGSVVTVASDGSVWLRKRAVEAVTTDGKKGAAGQLYRLSTKELPSVSSDGGTVAPDGDRNSAARQLVCTTTGKLTRKKEEEADEARSLFYQRCEDPEQPPVLYSPSAAWSPASWDLCELQQLIEAGPRLLVPSHNWETPFSGAAGADSARKNATIDEQFSAVSRDYRVPVFQLPDLVMLDPPVLLPAESSSRPGANLWGTHVAPLLFRSMAAWEEDLAAEEWDGSAVSRVLSLEPMVRAICSAEITRLELPENAIIRRVQPQAVVGAVAADGRGHVGGGTNHGNTVDSVPATSLLLASKYFAGIAVEYEESGGNAEGNSEVALSGKIVGGTKSSSGNTNIRQRGSDYTDDLDFAVIYTSAARTDFSGTTGVEEQSLLVPTLFAARVEFCFDTVLLMLERDPALHNLGAKQQPATRYSTLRRSGDPNSALHVSWRSVWAAWQGQHRGHSAQPRRQHYPLFPWTSFGALYDSAATSKGQPLPTSADLVRQSQAVSVGDSLLSFAGVVVQLLEPLERRHGASSSGEKVIAQAKAFVRALLFPAPSAEVAATALSQGVATSEASIVRAVDRAMSFPAENGNQQGGAPKSEKGNNQPREKNLPGDADDSPLYPEEEITSFSQLSSTVRFSSPGEEVLVVVVRTLQRAVRISTAVAELDTAGGQAAIAKGSGSLLSRQPGVGFSGCCGDAGGVKSCAGCADGVRFFSGAKLPHLRNGGLFTAGQGHMEMEEARDLEALAQTVPTSSAGATTTRLPERHKVAALLRLAFSDFLPFAVLPWVLFYGTPGRARQRLLFACVYVYAIVTACVQIPVVAALLLSFALARGLVALCDYYAANSPHQDISLLFFLGGFGGAFAFDVLAVLALAVGKLSFAARGISAWHHTGGAVFLFLAVCATLAGGSIAVWFGNKAPGVAFSSLLLHEGDETGKVGTGDAQLPRNAAKLLVVHVCVACVTALIVARSGVWCLSVMLLDATAQRDGAKRLAFLLLPFHSGISGHADGDNIYRNPDLFGFAFVRDCFFASSCSPLAAFVYVVLLAFNFSLLLAEQAHDYPFYRAARAIVSYPCGGGERHRSVFENGELIEDEDGIMPQRGSAASSSVDGTDSGTEEDNDEASVTGTLSVEDGETEHEEVVEFEVGGDETPRPLSPNMKAGEDEDENVEHYGKKYLAEIDAELHRMNALQRASVVDEFEKQKRFSRASRSGFPKAEQQVWKMPGYTELLFGGERASSRTTKVQQGTSAGAGRGAGPGQTNNKNGVITIASGDESVAGAVMDKLVASAIDDIVGDTQGEVGDTRESRGDEDRDPPAAVDHNAAEPSSSSSESSTKKKVGFDLGRTDVVAGAVDEEDRNEYKRQKAPPFSFYPDRDDEEVEQAQKLWSRNAGWVPTAQPKKSILKNNAPSRQACRAPAVKASASSRRKDGIAGVGQQLRRRAPHKVRFDVDNPADPERTPAGANGSASALSGMSAFRGWFSGLTGSSGSSCGAGARAQGNGGGKAKDLKSGTGGDGGKAAGFSVGELSRGGWVVSDESSDDDHPGVVSDGD